MISRKPQPSKPSAPSQSLRKRAVATTVRPEIKPANPARTTASRPKRSRRESASFLSAIGCSDEVPTVERKRSIAQNCNLSLSPKLNTFNMNRILVQFYGLIYLLQPFE